jgi:hypothetical protein
MTLPTSGPISLVDIQTEFGGPTPITLENYYRGGAYVLDTDYAPNVPESGPISLSNFYSAKRTGLTTVSKFYNYAELKEGHRQACFNYLRLRSELVLQLNVPMVEYANFMKTYHDKWLSIRENSPNLPGSIVASIKEKTDNIEQNYLLKFLEKANAQQQQQQSNIKIKIKNDIESNYNKDTETDTETDTG